jgi:membrane protein, antimicrobial resistance system
MTSATGEPISSLPPAKPKNVFARIAGVLFAPTETFEDIARKPDVLAPLILLLVLGYVCTFVLMPIIDWDSVVTAQTEAMRAKNPNIDNATIERVEGMTRTMGRIMGYIGPIFGVIAWLVVAGVLFLAFRLMGGQGTFKQAFSVTLYSWIPLTICSILMSIISYAKGSFNPMLAPVIVKSNPAFLVDMKEKAALFSLLSAFDLFTIWTLILLVFGFAIVSKFSKAKSAAIIVSLWLVAVLVKAGFAALGAAKAKG